MVSSREDPESRSLKQLYTFLSRPAVAAIFDVHPNQLQAGVSTVPDTWDWWSWASHSDAQPWRKILDYYFSDDPSSLKFLNAAANVTDSISSTDLPPSLVELLDNIKTLDRPREPIPIIPSPLAQRSSTVGQTPKKIHEVLRMSTYIENLLEELESDVDLKKLLIVDVGAGQGYLTRSIANILSAKYPSSKESPAAKRVLAIDSDELQTTGAQYFEAAIKKTKNSNTEQLQSNDLIEHRIARLTESELLNALDEWIGTVHSSEEGPVPIFFVALHACGSLTPSVLRAISTATTNPRKWYPVSAVVVGCCYNCLESNDFPLSSQLSEQIRLSIDPASPPPTPKAIFPDSAYNLATQTPLTWYLSERSSRQFELGLQKVVWRALLSGYIYSSRKNAAEELQISSVQVPGGTIGMGQTTVVQRMGKLNDKVYRSWDVFLAAAGDKMGYPFVDQSGKPLVRRDEEIESQLAVLQVLRFLLGPVAETLFIEDRRAWIQEMFTDGSTGLRVKLVNLFDQATGSGRNVAIVLTSPNPL